MNEYRISWSLLDASFATISGTSLIKADHAEQARTKLIVKLMREHHVNAKQITITAMEKFL